MRSPTSIATRPKKASRILRTRGGNNGADAIVIEVVEDDAGGVFGIGWLSLP